MTLLGSFALWVTWLLGIWAAIAAFSGKWRGRPELTQSIIRSSYAMFGLLLVAALSLWKGLLSHDFNIEYVASYTSSNLPTYYTIAAFWAGQRGSLLFWAFVLSIFAALAQLTTSKRYSYLLRGELRAADRGMTAFFAAARALTQDSEVTRFLNIAEPTAPTRIRASAGVATKADVERMERGLRSLTVEIESDARTSWENLVRILVFAAATVGDTAIVRRWSPEAPRPAFQALAYARAGDRAAAERFFQAGARDTLTAATHRFALGQAAELLGRPQDALRYYTALDSSNFEAGVPDVDWILLVRSLAARGALYQAQGDSPRARQFYQRFLELWKYADPQLKPQVDRVRLALGEMERHDNGDQ